MVGGCAGDNLRWAQTYQFAGTGAGVEILSGCAVGVALGWDGPFGVGVAHGWRAAGDPMMVNSSSEGRVNELDSRPGVTSTGSARGDATQVLGNADVAMYRAKKQGRGRIVRFKPHMHAEVARDLQLRSDLQGALSRGELWVRYQPIVDLEAGLPVAMEALMRWTHPEQGSIGPDLFIGLAEETGIVLELGAWVLRQAARRLVEWRRLVPSLNVTLNVSPLQLQHGGLVDEVRGTLAEFALPPAALTLEITESVLVADRATMAPTLKELSALGLHIAIDDFGIGHSFLAQLRQLRVHQLKIDRSCVNDLAESREAEAVFNLVLQLAQKLALDAVAEGVIPRFPIQSQEACGHRTMTRAA